MVQEAMGRREAAWMAAYMSASFASFLMAGSKIETIAYGSPFGVHWRPTSELHWHGRLGPTPVLELVELAILRVHLSVRWRLRPLWTRICIWIASGGLVSH